MSRTRVKICGLTRHEDVAAAVHAGADAVGFVCYAGSPRHVRLESLAAISREVPPFVTPVLLFVNADTAEVDAAVAAVPNALLQFHGDETHVECGRYSRPFVRAIRMNGGVDLLDCELRFAAASALLADAPADGYGGGGATFDWTLIAPRRLRRKPLILAGGLDETNVGNAIRTVRPFAVDVSSGVEVTRGIKSAERINRFIAAVRRTDAEIDDE